MRFIYLAFCRRRFPSLNECTDLPGSGDLRHFRAKHGVRILTRGEGIHRCSRQTCNKNEDAGY